MEACQWILRRIYYPYSHSYGEIRERFDTVITTLIEESRRDYLQSFPSPRPYFRIRNTFRPWECILKLPCIPAPLGSPTSPPSHTPYFYTPLNLLPSRNIREYNVIHLRNQISSSLSSPSSTTHLQEIATLSNVIFEEILLQRFTLPELFHQHISRRLRREYPLYYWTNAMITAVIRICAFLSNTYYRHGYSLITHSMSTQGKINEEELRIQYRDRWVYNDSMLPLNINVPPIHTISPIYTNHHSPSHISDLYDLPAIRQRPRPHPHQRRRVSYEEEEEDIGPSTYTAPPIILPQRPTRSLNNTADSPSPSPRPRHALRLVPIVIHPPPTPINAPRRPPPISIPLSFPPVPVPSIAPSPPPLPSHPRLHTPPTPHPALTPLTTDTSSTTDNIREEGDSCISRLIYRIQTWITNITECFIIVKGFPKMKRSILTEDYGDIDPISLEPLKKGTIAIHLDCSHILTELSFRRLIANGQSRCPLCRNPFEISNGEDGGGGEEGGGDEGGGDVD